MFAMFLFSVPTAVGFSIRHAKAVVVVMGVFINTKLLCLI